MSSLFGALAAALTPAGLLWTVIILGVSTFLHELAHYAAARRQGVAVPYFSVGMGPVLLKKQWRGTEWRISALPIGGYVNIDGMAADDEGNAPAHGYARLNPWGQIAILLLAPLTNLAIAFVLLTGLYNANGLNTPINTQIHIAQVLPQSRAEGLGLKAGDIITALDGQPIPEQLGQKPGWQKLSVMLSKSGPHSLRVLRGTQTLNFSFDWQATTAGGKPQKLGVAYGPVLHHTPLNLGAAAAQAGRDMVQAVPRTLQAFGGLLQRMLSFNIQPDEGVVGPVGTAQAVSQAAQVGAGALLAMAMAINLGLGLMNLLPIPGLDGGHILLIVLGMLRGRPLSFESYQRVTLGGFALLLLVGLFTFLRDIVRVMQ